MATNWKKVVVGYVDRNFVDWDEDMTLGAFLCGVTSEDDVHFVYTGGRISRRLDPDLRYTQELSDPTVLCLGIGGEGQVLRANFQPSGGCGECMEGGVTISDQAFQAIRYQGFSKLLSWMGVDQERLARRGVPLDMMLERLVKWVGTYDLQAQRGGELEKVFLGLSLVRTEPKQRLLEGIQIFRRAVECQLEPFGPIPNSLIDEWSEYLQAADQFDTERNSREYDYDDD